MSLLRKTDVKKHMAPRTHKMVPDTVEQPVAQPAPFPFRPTPVASALPPKSATELKPRAGK